MTVPKPDLAEIAKNPHSLAVRALENHGRKVPDPAGGRPGVSRRKRLEAMILHVQHISAAATYGLPSILEDYAAWLLARPGGGENSVAEITLSMRCAAEECDASPGGETAREFRLWTDRAILLVDGYDPDRNVGRQPKGPGARSTAAVFLKSLLEGRKKLAASIAETESRESATLPGLYDSLFAPSQRELGRLWRAGRITPAQEHFVTEATREIMAGFKPDFVFEDRSGELLAIAACPEGERHDMGLRMVSCGLEYHGWETMFLGADVTAEDMAAEVARRKPALAALSATMTPWLPALADMIAGIREASGGKTRILAGGAAIESTGDLWVSLGADGTARGCEEAAMAADALVRAAG